jgi:hypothetical protein
VTFVEYPVAPPVPIVAPIIAGPPQEATGRRPSPPFEERAVTLYEQLLAVRDANGSRAEIDEQVNLFRFSDRWIRGVAELTRWVALYEKIRRTPGVSSDPSLQSMIETALGIESLDRYVADGRSAAVRARLFDNLFATVIQPDDPPLREALLSALKVEQIIVEIAARNAKAEPAAEPLSPISMSFIVVLPPEIFPVPPPEEPATVTVDPPPAALPQGAPPASGGDVARGMQMALADLDAADAAVRRGQPPMLAPATQQLLATLRTGGAEVPIGEARAALAQSLAAVASSNAQAGATVTTLALANESVDASELCDPYLPDTCLPYQGGPLPKKPGRVHSLGIADLMVVRQKLQRYTAGEISHITNVMGTETRETQHRHLQRVEETVSVDRETTVESQRDLQSTERFSLANESKQVIQEETKFNAGVNVTGTYGVVTVTANAAYATSSSQQTSTNVASTYAKEITQRATEKVTERVREQRSRTTIEEIEETNRHAFMNDTSNHVVGIYQWVDVIYLARLFNLGKRLMLEFVIPEPAAFHIYSTAALQSSGKAFERPVAPHEPSALGVLHSATDITATNYAAWAARYGATEIEAPPPEWVTVAAAFASADPLTQYDLVTQKTLTVPNGYAADTAKIRLAHSTGVDGTTYARAFVGTTECLTVTGNQFFSLPMAGETGAIPINLQSAKTYLMANIEILCRLTAQARDAWKLATYTAIISAYERRMAAFEDALAAGAAGARGFSPSRNREIERQELKRGCLQLLTGQRFDAFSAMRVHQAFDYPEFLEGRAELEGKYMQFFEQACDWTNMTYTFYPYFWTRKPNWIRMLGYESDDPTFTNFLQAGAARVVVPAHPAYTKAVLHFLTTGEVWNGDDVPVVGDPLYISIVDELMEGSGFGESTDPVAEWEVRLPTTLTMLKTVDPGILPDWTSQ